MGVDATPPSTDRVATRLRRVSALPRAAASLAVGAASTVVWARFLPWPVAIVSGWDVAAAMIIVWIWSAVGGLDAERTQAMATREDDSRLTVEILLLSAAVVSLAGVGSSIAEARQAHGFSRLELTLASVLTVVLSWVLVHSLFALRYAHLYYTVPVGGVDFKSDAPPDYRDFAYLAFTVGMAFAVSDTDIGQSPMRRTVLRHALISYIFGVVIIAVLVNIVAGVL